MTMTDKELADIEARLLNPFDYVALEGREALARLFLEYDPKKDIMGTSYEHGDTLTHLVLLLRFLLQGRTYTLYQNTDFDIRVAPQIAGEYVRRTKRRKPEIQSALVLTQAYAPDLALILDQPPPLRSQRSYRIGRDGRAPHIAIEIASDYTAAFDIGGKPHLYCDIFGIGEYYVFDPRKGGQAPFWSGAQLRGWRQTPSGYEEIGADRRGRIWSEALQNWIGADDRSPDEGLLWLWDVVGHRQLTVEEAREIERIAREAETRRANTAIRCAEAERKIALEAEQRAKDAEAVAQRVEAENVRLREELRRAQGGEG